MSSFSSVVFLGLVGFVCVCLVLSEIASNRSASTSLPLRRLSLAIVGLGLWLGASAALASSGTLSRFDAFPPPAMLLMLAFFALTLAFAFSPVGKGIAAGVPLAALVGFQVFRVPLEWLLHRLYTEGVLPPQVTYAGWNFDVVTGLLAAVLALALWRGNVATSWVRAWNVLGLVLLAVVVVTAVLSLPTPFQRFTAEPSTAQVVTFPLVWLPTVLVQAALLGHVLVFIRLRRDS